jgi:hypothetical protein
MCEVVRRRAHQHERLAEALRHLALALGDAAGSRRADHRAMPMSV